MIKLDVLKTGISLMVEYAAGGRVATVRFCHSRQLFEEVINLLGVKAKRFDCVFEFSFRFVLFVKNFF